MTPALETITAPDGTPIAFQRTGSGPFLVVVHGTAADHTRWAPVLPALEAQFTVCALDRRGRGGSGDAQPYALEREFEDIAAVVDSLGGPVHLLGHSFGAVCALGAARLAARLRSLTLYEPPPAGVPDLTPPEVAAEIERHLAAGDRAEAVRAFFRGVVHMPAHELEMLAASPAWLARVAAAHTLLREARALEAQPPPSPDHYQVVTVPALLLLGGDSPAYFRASIAAVQAALPASRVVVLPGQQHVAINTAPDLFVREVTCFLAEAELPL